MYHVEISATKRVPIHERWFLLFTLTFMIVLLSSGVTALAAVEGDDGAEVSVETPPEPKMVVTINGVVIDERLLASETNRIIPGRLIHGSLSQGKLTGIRRKALENLVIDELIYQAAQKSSVKVTERDVKKRLKDIKKRYKEPFEDVIAKAGFSIEDVTKQIRKEILLARYMKRRDKIFWTEVRERVDEAFMRGYYDKNMDKFKIPERVRLSEILIKADPGGGPKHWAEIKAQADKALERIRGGEEFAKVAREVSDSPYAKQGGEMGFVHRGSFLPEIEEAVKNLKVGKLVGPVWTLHGYHIFRLEEVAPSIQRTFDEVKATLEGELEEKEFEKVKEQMIADLKKSANIKYADDIEKVLNQR